MGGDGGCNDKVPKENIIGVFHDLEEGKITSVEIASKWGVSKNLVCGINTGRYWHQDGREYPIRKRQPKTVKIENGKKKRIPYKTNCCAKCGTPIVKSSTYCKACYDAEYSKHIP